MKPKIKVGFYLNNQRYASIDLRFIEQGNPGLGGTQFTTIATAYYLNKYYPDKVEILLFANSTELLPPSLKVYHALNEVDALFKSEKQECDIFVFRSTIKDDKFFDHLSKLQIKAIARSNNYPNYIRLNQIANCQQIKALVCVSHEQLDDLRDHRVFDKATRIFHPFNPQNFVPKTDVSKQENTVVFLGNLIPKKGFHYLARVWPYILKKKPEAKLIVVGSAKLYNPNTKLGKWGVAEETYEANFIRPFLSDENGNIHKSVSFTGLLGLEKIDILQRADVGVVNPSGASETFCSAAVEIQACGTPVVSAAKGGLLDTVAHEETGLLSKNDRELARNIIYFLENPTVARQFGANGIKHIQDKFSCEQNARHWLELFIDICNNKPLRQPPMKNNYLYQAKFLKERMRIFKKHVPLLRNVPALIEIKPLVKELIKRG